MASGKLTSTPLQFRYDSGFGSYGKHCSTLPDVAGLSPIRKQRPSTPLINVYRVCRLFSDEAEKTKTLNETFGEISKNLTLPSPTINKSDSSKPSVDSGIISNDSIENENVCERVLAVSTDENFNIVPFCDKTDNRPVKYICAEDWRKLTQFPQNELIDQSLCLSRLFGNDVSANTISDNVQKNTSKLDLFYELAIRNCRGILSDILSHLSGEDLGAISCVCKQWQNIVLDDKKANEKRKAFVLSKKIKTRGPNKENRDKILSPVGRSHKSAFASVINAKDQPLPLLVLNCSGRFDSFVKEAKLIIDKNKLKKCPRCRYPSKAVSESMFCCTRKLCEYEFCEKCSGPYLNNHTCPVPGLDDSMENIIINSKKSKKYLRRL